MLKLPGFPNNSAHAVDIVDIIGRLGSIGKDVDFSLVSQSIGF